MDWGLVRHTDSNSAVEKGANRTSTLTSTTALFARKDNLLQSTWSGSRLRWLNDWPHPWPAKHTNATKASMQTIAGNIFLPSIFTSISTRVYPNVAYPRRGKTRQSAPNVGARRLGQDEQYLTVREILSEASTLSDGALSGERSDFYRFGYATLGFIILYRNVFLQATGKIGSALCLHG